MIRKWFGLLIIVGMVLLWFRVKLVCVFVVGWDAVMVWVGFLGG